MSSCSRRLCWTSAVGRKVAQGLSGPSARPSRVVLPLLALQPRLEGSLRAEFLLWIGASEGNGPIRALVGTGKPGSPQGNGPTGLSSPLLTPTGVALHSETPPRSSRFSLFPGRPLPSHHQEGAEGSRGLSVFSRNGGGRWDRSPWQSFFPSADAVSTESGEEGGPPLQGEKRIPSLETLRLSFEEIA